MVSSFGQRKYTKGYYSFLHSRPKEPIKRKEQQVARVPEISHEKQSAKAKDAPMKIAVSLNHIMSNIVIKEEKRTIATFKKDREIEAVSNIHGTPYISANNGNENYPQENSYFLGIRVVGVVLYILGFIGTLVFGIQFLAAFSASKPVLDLLVLLLMSIGIGYLGSIFITL